MDSTRFQHVKQLVLDALQRDPAQREQFLTDACAGDDELKAEAQQLLAVDNAERTERLLNPIDLKGQLSHDGADGADARIGQRIGSYEITERLGAGGMGTVYRAKRIDDYSQTVAIKLVKRGMDSAEILRRFKTEMQLLAALGEHSNIARLLDAGTTGEGLPYFVMEFVDGQWINVHCANNDLSVIERLNLFHAVCDAVQFAHQRAVIHRDLKPSNILIAADGAPKLIDFGIAKLTRDDFAEFSVVQTQTQYRAFTPNYASPEQVRGEPVTTASDVYSLGVVLYELLTGTRPYHLSDETPHQWAQVISETEPRRPSTAIRSLARQATTDEPLPQDTNKPTRRPPSDPPRRLARLLSGDLDNIVLMALRKEPERRYETVQQLADDIDRYRDGRPVRARADTLAYRTTKFVKRNKVAVTFVTLLVLSLLGGLAGVAWQTRNAQIAQRDRALAQTDALLTATPEAVPVIIDNLEPFRDEVEPRLRSLLEEGGQSETAARRIRLALLDSDPTQVEFLYGGLERADPAELLVLRDALVPYAADLNDRLWRVLENESTPQPQRLRVASALARFDPQNARWKDSSKPVVDALVAENPFLVGDWGDALRPVRHELIEPLSVLFHDTEQNETARNITTRLLADYAGDQVDVLAELINESDPSQFGLLFPAITAHAERAAELFAGELALENDEKAIDPEKDVLASRQANAAVALFLLGHRDKVWPLLVHTPDPRVRSFLIHRFATGGAQADDLIARFHEEPDLSARRALLLSLGEFDRRSVTAEDFETIRQTLTDLIDGEPDAGLRGAALWLSRAWDLDVPAAPVGSSATSLADRNGANWFNTPHGDTMVIIDAPQSFKMGSIQGEPGRMIDEFYHTETLGRRYAIAATEVTVDQFSRYLKDHPGTTEFFAQRYAPKPDSARVSVTWYEAAKYCRWLSEQEGLAEDQMCFPPFDEIKHGMQLSEDYLERTGYRLPLEGEWEYACRAGSTTSRYYGYSEDLLEKYAWYLNVGEDHTWPVGSKKPNDFGLFDMLGNAWEWCHDPWMAIAARTSREVWDLKPPDDQGGRILRGGSYGDSPILVRSADRNMYRPSGALIVFGFRVARTMPDP